MTCAPAPRTQGGAHARDRREEGRRERARDAAGDLAGAPAVREKGKMAVAALTGSDGDYGGHSEARQGGAEARPRAGVAGELGGELRGNGNGGRGGAACYHCCCAARGRWASARVSGRGSW